MPFVICVKLEWCAPGAPHMSQRFVLLSLLQSMSSGALMVVKPCGSPCLPVLPKDEQSRRFTQFQAEAEVGHSGLTLWAVAAHAKN